MAAKRAYELEGWESEDLYRCVGGGCGEEGAVGGEFGAGDAAGVGFGECEMGEEIETRRG